MITVYTYIAWGGKRQFQLKLSPSGVSEPTHLMHARSTILSEADARTLLAQLTAAIASRPECIDCGSDLHTVDDPSCPVSNAAERDCAD
jgi:hypothetical protein